MNIEGLDCWDDYPMEYGCICGNDCASPRTKVGQYRGNRPPDSAERARVRELLAPPTDPFPFAVGPVRLAYPGTLNGSKTQFDPRPGYNQNREDYA